MFLLLLILTLCTQIYSQSSLLCEYTLRSGNYECMLTIYNEAGWDNFTHISGPHLSGRQNIDVLDLTSTSRGSLNIPRRICQQFNNLQRMIMSNLGITVLSESSLDSCSSIGSFDVSNNKIETIAYGTFVRLNNLHSINLQSNRLTKLTELHFRATAGLTSLNIQNNPSIHLEPLVFHQLYSLERIYLMNCSITVWYQSWFNQLRRLQVVDISNNLLTSIPDYAFHANSALTSLSFSNNNINNLNREIFGNLNQLSILRAVSNKIYTIDRRIFYNAGSLYSAWFNHNYCIDVNINDFQGNFSNNMQYFNECFEDYDNGPWYYTTDGIHYIWRTITGRGIMVSVKAARHAQIIVSPTDTGAIPHVETALDLNSNTLSTMFENGIQCTAEHCNSNMTNVINAEEFSNFNITWHVGNNIVVNKEGLGLPFMFLVREMFDVNYFGIGTIDNIGEWIIRRMP